jgi:hypothetical protein
MTMEDLFSPCTRLRYVLEESLGWIEGLRGLQELDLDLSTEELLSAERGFTFADLHDILLGFPTVAWLTPHASVMLPNGVEMDYWEQVDQGGSYNFCFTADGKDLIAFARSSEHILEICDIVVRLLAVSEVHSLHFTDWTPLEGAFINAPTLAYMMEQCRSLKVLSLNDLEIDADQCRVLGTYSRPGLEIELDECKITSAGVSALVEVLGQNQGPTKIASCNIDNVVLADGLRGNSRLKSLKPRISNNVEVGNQELLEIADALKENKGLVDLDLTCDDLDWNDEAWDAVCDSLETHPTLEVLDLCSTFEDDTMTPAVLEARIQALVDMMKVNMSIHTIHLNARLSHHELLRESVIPYLATNRFRPRLLAVQQTRPIAYHAKVLGRALLAVRTDPNRFWMLLSGNAEVAFS